MYFYLLQLEKDGFLITEWAPKETSDGKELLTLKQISLTTSGKKLLSELKAKSRTEKLKNRLEPISKSSEQYADGGQLHEAKEVLGIVLPANQEPTLPLNPGKETLDKPSPLIAS